MRHNVLGHFFVNQQLLSAAISSIPWKYSVVWLQPTLILGYQLLFTQIALVFIQLVFFHHSFYDVFFLFFTMQEHTHNSTIKNKAACFGCYEGLCVFVTLVEVYIIVFTFFLVFLQQILKLGLKIRRVHNLHF